MRRLKKEELKKEKKSFEMFEALSRSGMNFIKGGDGTNENNEKGGDQ
ncbi:MAG: hypothetical protein PVH61_40695 [Candidatus Aminicenantes bacterium]|jgi:hypothetical protein